MPRLSFVVPCHNAAAWLPHAVTSILGIQDDKGAPSQTFKDIELVVVDDCSTDSTGIYLDWLKNQGHSNLIVWRSEKKLGRSEARNLGNRIATGKYIAVLDADDLAAPNRASLTVKKFEETGAEFVYGSASVIDALGTKVGEFRAETFNLDRALSELKNKIVHSSVAYTKEFSSRFAYRVGELADLGLDDWAQQIEAAISGVKMAYIPQTICAYRLLDSGISAKRDESKVVEAKRRFLDSLKVAA